MVHINQLGPLITYLLNHFKVSLPIPGTGLVQKNLYDMCEIYVP